MRGVVVEIQGLKNKTEWNGKRGYIQEIINDKPVKYKINVDNTELGVSNDYLHKVYCLGLPCEYWITRECDEQTLLVQMLNEVDSTKFYVFVESDSRFTTAFLFNVCFFEMALDKMGTEPLLRVYGMKKSQTETKIVFDQRCVNVIDDLSKPWFVDLTSQRFLELVSRFDTDDCGNFENCENAHALRNQNFRDFVPGNA